MANGKIRVWIVPSICLLAFVGSWYVRGNDLEHLEKDVAELQQTPVKIAQLETGQKTIKEDIKEIKTEQKENQIILYKIWGKVNSE